MGPRSTASITELILEELGVLCEKVTLDIQKGDTKKPEFVALNPNANVRAWSTMARRSGNPPR